MSFGLIARADFGRGLANQTYSFWKHLQPDVTVVVDMSRLDPKGAWPQNLDAYPDAIITTWGGYTAPFDNPTALRALQDCDIIYTAETHYDERLQQMPSILHVNPEFFRHQQATQYWYPTVWRTGDLPPGHIVPTPIDDERIALQIPGPGKLLHVGGHRTWGDRNGSQIVHGILQRSVHPWKLTSQDGFRLHPRVLGYVQPVGYVEDRWTLYDDAAILVSPRRFGGQSLPVDEAMARGLAVVMTDCSPNIETWPIIPIPSKPGGRVKTPGGLMDTAQMLPKPLIDTIGTLMGDSDMLERWQTRSLLWARDNAWSQQLARIEEFVYG